MGFRPKLTTKPGLGLYVHGCFAGSVGYFMYCRRHFKLLSTYQDHNCIHRTQLAHEGFEFFPRGTLLNLKLLVSSQFTFAKPSLELRQSSIDPG